MIENGTFLYKTCLSKVNFKTSRIRSTKLTYRKERCVAPNYDYTYEFIQS